MSQELQQNNRTRSRLERLLVVAIVMAVFWGCTAKGTSSDSTDSASAQAAAKDAATLCRELTPSDPYREKEDRSERAYDACREAAAASPEDASILHLLGVSALASDHQDEAIDAFKKAEQLGSCPALSFLGDMAWFQDEDGEAADDYYQRGAECGDRRASKLIFSSAAFKMSAYPDKLAALYNSDIESLNRVRFINASYVDGFYEALSEQFLGKEFDPCWTTTYYRGGDVLYGIKAAEKGDASNFIIGPIYEEYLPAIYKLLLPEQGDKALEELRQTLRRAGHADLLRVVQASSCGARMPRKFIDGIEAFSRTKKTLLEVAQDRYSTIHSFDDLIALLKGNQ
jgi:hypothetical protein